VRVPPDVRGMGIDPQLWLLAGAVFLLAGVVKGMVGMGLPTIAMGSCRSSCRRPRRPLC